MKLDMGVVNANVQHALNEDIGSGDVTASLLAENKAIKADIISREPMVVCGRPWVDTVFKTVHPDLHMHWFVNEGQVLKDAEVLCSVQGLAKHILTAERTALNFFQTLSATASSTHQYVQQLQHTSAKLLDTRKTLPGLRLAQKYAVQCGGGVNHRFGLYDAFLIKENHIKACGSIAKAIDFARSSRQELFLEIEVENLKELQEALHARPDRILLDNFTVEMLIEAVKMNTPKCCELEASGGITITNIEMIAQTGVDYISVGSITKSISAIDLSLIIKE